MVLSSATMLRLLALSLCAAAATFTTAAAQDAPVAKTPAPAAAPANAEAVVPKGVTPEAPATPTAPAAPAAPAAKSMVSINRCNVEGPFIAITFDDGPHGDYTPRLLKMLSDRSIKATFFVVGQCVAEYPEIAKQIVKEGHEIANHSWSHPSLIKMGTESVRDQLGRTHNVVAQEVGVEMKLMRPPYGSFSVQQRAWANATWGYTTVIWDVDSLDWQHRSPAKTQSIIMANTKPGSVILCHDIHKTTIDAMPATLDALLAKGFKFVTVTELIKMNRAPAAPVKAVKAASVTAGEAKSAATSIEDLKKPAPRKTTPPKKGSK